MLHEWDNFAVIAGSAAGALTGLLFVAVSLNRDRIVGHAGLRAEAGQTLALFLLALLLSVILVIPGVSATTLGVVLVVVAAAAAILLTLIGRNDLMPKRYRQSDRRPTRSESQQWFSSLSAEDQLYRLLDVTSLNLFSTVSITVAGCLQLAGSDGLYWLAAAILLAMFSGVYNAWLFLTRPASDPEPATKPDPAGVPDPPGGAAPAGSAG